MTAERIHDGIKKQNGTSKIWGLKEYLVFSQSDTNKISSYRDRDGKRLLDNWISGRYPPWEVESCSELAKRVAYEIVKNLAEIGPGQIDLYVSHDIIISAMMFFWLGVYKHYDWLGYLDGFILQLFGDKMRYLDKEGEYEVYFPYWWNFKG